MTLEKLRSQVDDIDRRLVRLIAERFEVCREIAAVKSRTDMPTMQPARAETVKLKVRELAAGNGLNPDFIAGLYDAIIAEACRIEDEERDR